MCYCDLWAWSEERRHGGWFWRGVYLNIVLSNLVGESQTYQDVALYMERESGGRCLGACFCQRFSHMNCLVLLLWCSSRNYVRQQKVLFIWRLWRFVIDRKRSKIPRSPFLVIPWFFSSKKGSVSWLGSSGLQSEGLFGFSWWWWRGGLADVLSIVIEVSFFKFLPASSSALVQVPGKQSLLVYFRFYNVF